MTEKPGHFEQGRWVEDPAPAAKTAAEPVIDKRLTDATKSVVSSIDQMMGVARDLLTTEEGKKYIGKTLEDTKHEIGKSFDAVLRQAKEEVDRHTRR